MLRLIYWNETAIGTSHVSDHLACNFGRFGRNGSGLSAGDGLAAVVGVAAGGDEKGEVEESERCGLASWRGKQ